MKFENVEEGSDGCQAGGRSDRSVHAGGDRSRNAEGATKVVRPQVKLLDAEGNEVKIPGTDHSVTIGFPGRRADPGA